MSARSALALVAAAALLLAACSDDEPAPEGEPVKGAPPAAPPLQPTLTQPSGTTVVAGMTATDLALATSAAVFATAPVVVVAPLDDPAAQARAASLAVQLGAPMLLAAGGESAPPAASDAPTGATPTDAPTDATPTDDPTDAASPDATPTDAPTGATPTDDPATTAAVTAEIERLGAAAVLDVGGAAERLGLGEGVTVVPAPVDRAALETALGVAPGGPQPVAAADVVAAVAALDPATPALLEVSDVPASAAEPPPAASDLTLPVIGPAAALTDVLVLATTDPAWVASTATARAAGARVQVLSAADPRADAAAVEALAAEPPSTVLALGDAFGTPETLQYRLDVAATGTELPGGGQVLFPGRRMVALYGNPTSASLGVLGEQPLDAAITRAQQTAADYDGLWGDDTVVPAFEVIATVASAFAGPDGNYSTEMTIDELRPYVDAAREAGVYVVLDLQPGRTDFLTQAKIYEELLTEPNVGLALDPEWRLEPDQVHLVQTGSVDVAEVNQVVTWLADLTRENTLPQKLLLLHQFRLDMIEGRENVDTTRDELAVLIHADGNGPPGSKYATYDALTASPPPNVWWGWKNFYDEDSPTFTPAETAAVEPSPVFVSYQ